MILRLLSTTTLPAVDCEIARTRKMIKIYEMGKQVQYTTNYQFTVYD
jgi:hypothetical protein